VSRERVLQIASQLTIRADQKYFHRAGIIVEGVGQSDIHIVLIESRHPDRAE
jgi:hypothetical protein